MPRTGRIVVPNWPHHVIQRGHNRRAVFAAREQFEFYLENLIELKLRLGCRIHAYCLMNNHVHLIIDPGDDPSSLATLMKHLAGRHTRYLNSSLARTGSAWEGRFKSSLIETEAYLLGCCRYAELNPLRAGLCMRPEDYEWSSYREKIGLRTPRWLDEDPCYISLGSSRREREMEYAHWVSQSIAEDEIKLIRTAVARGQLTGSRRFVEQMTPLLNRRVAHRGPGRPPRD